MPHPFQPLLKWHRTICRLTDLKSWLQPWKGKIPILYPFPRTVVKNWDDESVFPCCKKKKETWLMIVTLEIKKINSEYSHQYTYVSVYHLLVKGSSSIHFQMVWIFKTTGWCFYLWLSILLAILLLIIGSYMPWLIMHLFTICFQVPPSTFRWPKSPRLFADVFYSLSNLLQVCFQWIVSTCHDQHFSSVTASVHYSSQSKPTPPSIFKWFYSSCSSNPYATLLLADGSNCFH